jgi:hypothetical protein
MRFRLYEISTGGKCSLYYLFASMVALFVGLGGATDFSPAPWLVLSFPLITLAAWLLPVERNGWMEKHLTREGVMILFLCLMVCNSYLWGHTIAFVSKRLVKLFANRADSRS